MIKAALFILALILGIIVAPIWSGNTGYIMIQAWGYTLETSLVVFVVLLLAALGFIALFTKAFRAIVGGRLGTRKWLHAKREHRAVVQLRQAFNAWLQRDYEHCAKLADNSRSHHPDPQLAYALAAAAYGEIGEREQQRKLLTDARLAGFEDDALELLQLINTQDANEALTLAQGLSKRKKLTAAQWRAIAEQLARFGHWNTLRDLLPSIERQSALSATRLHKIKRLCFQAYFRTASNAQALEQAWRSLARNERNEPAVRIAYVEVLVAKGHHAIAAKVTAKGLKRGVLNLHEIIALSPELWASDETLHTWIGGYVKEHPNNADALLLYAATRFVERNFELAERALNQALAVRSDQYGYRLLGETLLATGKPEAALQAFRKASGVR